MNTLLNDTALKVPEKFIDKETNEIRIDALLKSYSELEKKLAQSAPKNSVDDLSKIDPLKIRSFLGVPENPGDYKINISHELFTEDDAINEILHDKGFTRDQAQTVYDLAAQYMVPLILDIAREFEAERQVERLTETFGGKDRYREVARQLLAFGKKNVPQDVLDGLSCSYEGVMALYRMMRDPKYWREKDPTFVKKVSEGFRQVFADPQQN